MKTKIKFFIFVLIFNHVYSADKGSSNYRYSETEQDTIDYSKLESNNKKSSSDKS